MAFTQRHLTTGLTLFFGLVAAAQTHAQPEAEPSVLFRTIAVGTQVSGLFYEISPGKPVAVSAGGAALSVPYVSPASGELSFYRELPPEEPNGKPRRVPVAEVHLGKSGPYMVILTSAASSADSTTITPIVVDDSWSIHPLQTVRVFNFSKRHAAVMVAEETVEMDTNQSHVFSYPPKKGSFRFKVALVEANGWILRVSCPQGVIPDTRSTIVITDVVPTENEPHPVDVNITNVFDFTKPPPPPGK